MKPLLKDKRCFKRYPTEIDTFLLLDSKPLKAKIVDYSLQGVGAIIYDIPSDLEGKILYCKAEQPGLKCPGRIIRAGKIVRAEKTDSGIMIGMKKIGNLEGSIKDYRVNDTLLGLQRSQATGVLRFNNNDLIKSIYISKGDMIFSTSNQDEDRLAYKLRKKGHITNSQYIQSVMEMRSTGQKIGQVLVRLGYITPQELFKAVRHQVEEIIQSFFGYENGIFEFTESQLPVEKIIKLNMSTANLIYHGTKGINNFNVLRNELPEMQSILHFSSEPVDLFQDISLDDSGKKIISCIDNKSTIMDIISLTKLDRLDALKTICALLNVRILTIEPVIDVPEDTIKEVIGEIIEEESEQRIAPDLKNIIEEMYSKYSRLGYYGVLGLKDNASPSDIKRAYFMQAKKFHPDIHHHISNDSVKNKLSSIFSYINDAYLTLSNPQKRKKYDKSIYIR